MKHLLTHLNHFLVTGEALLLGGWLAGKASGPARRHRAPPSKTACVCRPFVVRGHLKPATEERFKTRHLESNGRKVAGLPKPGFFGGTWQIISRCLQATVYKLWPSEVGRDGALPGNWTSTVGRFPIT